MEAPFLRQMARVPIGIECSLLNARIMEIKELLITIQ